MANLDAFLLEEAPKEMEILNPNTLLPLEDEETGERAILLVYGKDSDTYKKIAKKHMARLVDRMNAGRGSLKQTPEEMEANQEELTVACVVGFKNLSLHGKELVYSKEAVKDLFKMFPFIYRQVNVFISEDSNFLKQLPEPLPTTAEDYSS